jgi:hypothetical protein
VAPGLEAFRNSLQVSLLDAQVAAAAARRATPQQEPDSGQQAGSLGLVLDLPQQLLDLANLAVSVHFRRQESRVLQDAVSGAQFLRDQRVVVQCERRAGAGQIVELAAFLRLAYAALGDRIQAQHGGV